MFTSYYKGGFEPKMTRREAGLILGETLQIILLQSPRVYVHVHVQCAGSVGIFSWLGLPCAEE